MKFADNPGSSGAWNRWDAVVSRLQSVIYLTNLQWGNKDYYSFKTLPQPATDDQIWKNFAFNEPMTSKVQLSCRLFHR